jgi:lysophosphatidylcholine acyltransferase/lyso-PAF acetyltransferase
LIFLNSLIEPQKLSKFQIFILGISISHTGEPAPRNEAPIIVLAPHTTIIDGLFGAHHEMLTGSLATPVVKSGIRDMPLVGALCDICNPIYVNKESGKSRSNIVHEIEKRVNFEQPYPQVAMFPEATNTNAQSLLTFKIGAFIPRG